VKGRKRTMEWKETKKEKNTMKKSFIASFSILAILVLSLTLLMLPIRIESAKADNLSMLWGHLNPYMDIDEDEKALAEDVCDDIYWLFDNDAWGIWEPMNNYWLYTNDTVVEWVFDFANYGPNGVTEVTNWWVGDIHASEEYPLGPDPFKHFELYGHDDTNITDLEVYDWATEEGDSKHTFNFIWACTSGGIYWDDPPQYYSIPAITEPDFSSGPPPSPHPSPNPTNNHTAYGFYYEDEDEGAVGMPFAWTGKSDMNLTGYYYDGGLPEGYVFIGFEGPSPFMKNILNGTSVQAADFPVLFYEQALGYHTVYYVHRKISESLDYASANTFGVDFDDSIFYNGDWYYFTYGSNMTGWWLSRMRVLGNADRYKP
jgi:hypothetical protein